MTKAFAERMWDAIDLRKIYRFCRSNLVLILVLSFVGLQSRTWHAMVDLA
jgi:hypothetical protein